MDVLRPTRGKSKILIIEVLLLRSSVKYVTYFDSMQNTLSLLNKLTYFHIQPM